MLVRTYLRAAIVGGLVFGSSSLAPTNALAEDVIGEWAGPFGEGGIWASVRRGRAKPEYMVADISVATGPVGCGGRVTVYGKFGIGSILAESYDPSTPDAPLCKVRFDLSDREVLKITEVEGCVYYHGAACEFSGTLTRPLHSEVPSNALASPPPTPVPRKISAASDLNDCIHSQPSVAIEACTASLEALPEHDARSQAVLANRGLAYLVEGRFEAALGDFSDALRLGEPQPYLLAARGVAYLELGRSEEAISDFSDAIDMKPSTDLMAELLYNRGKAHASLEKYAHAWLDYTITLSMQSNNIGALVNRGIILHTKNDLELARRDFEAALSLAENKGLAEIHADAVILARNHLQRMELNRGAEVRSQAAAAIKPPGANLSNTPERSRTFDFKGVYIGQPATPELIRNRLGVSCNQGHDNRIVCNGRVTIAEAYADMNLVIGDSGNVQRISLDFSSRSYKDVEWAMNAKFGEPDRRKVVPVTNGFGARFETIESEWIGDDVYIRMRSIAGSTDWSSVNFQSEEDIEMFRSDREGKLGDL